VDADTWLYHWRRGEVSGWLRPLCQGRGAHRTRCRHWRSRFPTMRMRHARRCEKSSSANTRCRGAFADPMIAGTANHQKLLAERDARP
jgi:hypothetical protein